MEFNIAVGIFHPFAMLYCTALYTVFYNLMKIFLVDIYILAFSFIPIA